MKEVKFSLVFRDMWQSAGKYQPRVDQLVKIAPAIIKMGCFDRVETNGGGFEQVNLLYGENPNKSVREWTKPFHEAGIQTHMLDRALNALRMSPVPKDVRKLFYKVKKAQEQTSLVFSADSTTLATSSLQSSMPRKQV